MGDERRINQLTAKAYDNIGSSDYFAVDNASEAESKKLPASSIKTPISNLQGEVTGGSDTYSSTKNYSVGMYATHTIGGVQKLYRCKTACTAASWTTNASCFEEANLADAVSQLNNDLPKIAHVSGTTGGTGVLTTNNLPVSDIIILSAWVKFGTASHLVLPLEGFNGNWYFRVSSIDTNLSPSENETVTIYYAYIEK